MMNKDFLGQEIYEGDEVIFMQKNYRNLMKGCITKLTPKKVKIEHKETNVCSRETIQDKDQVIKIPIVAKYNYSLLDLLKPALDLGAVFEIYSESGTLCVDLNTQAKSGCVIKIEDGKFVAYRRYNRRNEFETFEDLLWLVHECGHGRDYFNGIWLKIFQKYGYSDPRGFN